ncbi:phenolic acid decarboxylase BsdC [Actinoallomurus oryzae]|uniref:Phenolic acid decarboxylase BsdC n=1 Tax=Actinoallomurus oryzae TaxID=502180 RepID=A0ABP8Q7E7_9ACTN
MPYADLREFLRALEKAGQLLRITDEVMPEPDLGAAARAANNLGDRSPALLFDNIHGYRDATVALNVIGSWPNHALMMGLPADTPVKEQFFAFAERYRAFPVAPERRGAAPWQEVGVRHGINLFELLPLFRLNRHDGGFYIDKACVVTRDPDDPGDFGRQNVGIYRLQVKGPDVLGIQPVPQHDAGLHLRLAEERGENLPIAIAVGTEPVIGVVAGMPLAYDQSEYEMAGAIQGAPYSITAAPLTGLDVPWGAEVVLEGEVLAGRRELEGPFGEFTGHYTGGRRLPVVKIHQVSMRPRPIFEQLYLGMPWTELDHMVGINTCVPLYEQLKADFPEIEAVNAMYTHGLVAIISTRRRYGGFAKAVGLRALTTPHGLAYCKVVIVVDETVDPFNLPQVMWALSTKFHPGRDTVRVPGLSVTPLDPGSEPPGVTDKLILDATTPVAPDVRGHHGHQVHDPAETARWEAFLKERIA